MYVFSTFEHSTYLELVLNVLEEKGIQRKDILAVPIETKRVYAKLFDTIHSSDNISMFDKGMALATAFSVIGASYGFVLEWGPIFWGIIGAVTGFFLGFLWDYLKHKRERSKSKKTHKKSIDVILVVVVEDNHKADFVAEILWDHFALGVGKWTKDPDLKPQMGRTSSPEK